MVTVRAKKLDERAKIPTYATPGSAGVDIYALEQTEIWAGELAVIRTGLAIELPDGYEGQVRPRSGLTKQGIVGQLGTIDCSYRGELGVLLLNIRSTGRYLVRAGDRVGQLVVQQVPTIRFEEAAQLSSSERGVGGFGSTGR